MHINKKNNILKYPRTPRDAMTFSVGIAGLGYSDCVPLFEMK